MKVALIYDRVNKWGGAERTLLALHELFPEAPLYTAVYSPAKAKWAKVFPKVIPSFLQKLPYAKDRHEFLGTITPIAFESLIFDEYDLVISVTSEAAKGVITKPSTRHICYCLTPTRYLWSGYNYYFGNRFLRFLSKPVVAYLKKWERTASQRPDVMIGISNAVKVRIKKYYNRDVKVVFPPADINKFKMNNPLRGQKLKAKNFYLIVGRLVAYKRVDLAIEAFNRLGLPLVIIGKGSQERKLKSMAKDNIKFLGGLTDARLADYYRKCTALIFPQEEDFGIVTVEAQASGAPIIAFKAGGALDTVIDGKTGTFFDKQDVDSLVKTVQRFQKIDFDYKDLIKNAQRFSKSRFKREFLKLIR